jgi:hypothetical protein
LQWHDPLGTIVGTVTSGPEGPPMAGIPVWFDWLPDTLRTDSRGHFTVREVPPGTYRIHTVDPILLAFHLARVTTVLTTASEDSVTTVPLAVAPDTTVQRVACGPPGMSDSSAVALVSVTSGDDPPDHDLMLDAVWAKPIGSGPDSLAARPFGTLHRKLKEREGGRFILCDLVRGGVVSVRVSRDEAVLADTVFSVGTRRPVSFTPVRLRSQAADQPKRLGGDCGDRCAGALRGVVTDDAGVPLADVDLWLGSAHAQTDSAGAFVFPRVAPGAVTIAAYHRGYRRLLASLTVTPQPSPAVHLILPREPGRPE